MRIWKEPTLWTSIYEMQFSGYSGEGFVYLTNETITVDVEVPEEGMYEFSTRCVQVLDKSDGNRRFLSTEQNSCTKCHIWILGRISVLAFID